MFRSHLGWLGVLTTMLAIVGNAEQGRSVSTNSVKAIELRVQTEIQYQRSSSINIDVLLKNTGDTGINYDEPYGTFRVEVFDALNKAVPLTDEGRKLLGPRAVNGGSSLRAGASLGQRYDLQRLFNLDKDGAYYVTVSRDFDVEGGWGKVQVKAHEFYIGIRPRARLGVPD